MTITQILALVRAKILESSSEIITDDTLLIYANLVKDDIVKRAFPNNQIQSATVTFTNGVGSLPADFGTLYGDAFKDIGNYYPELSIDDFQKQTASQAVTIEGGQIKVYPDSTASLTIKYYPTYPDLTLSVSPTFDTYFHEPIVYGILARAYEDLQDVELASFNVTKYENMLNQKIALQSQYEETNQRSSQLFSEQDLLSGGTTFI